MMLRKSTTATLMSSNCKRQKKVREAGGLQAFCEWKHDSHISSTHGRTSQTDVEVHVENVGFWPTRTGERTWYIQAVHERYTYLILMTAERISKEGSWSGAWT